ncbi:hypothetical protein FQN55_009257 [Onygenales sp. PD_40]|nr:hypothetical protein FQN55_009257 [Onygenales sp. PD_40]KAK2781366.1 hypothetical protein FQN52_001659 [Onygenales sp. PD_12]
MAAEPPAKRARRTDSSAMWEMNDHPSRPAPAERASKDIDTTSRRDIPVKEDIKRNIASRDDHRQRSPSRDRDDRRRDRSRSRDRRNRGRGRDGRREGDRDGRGGRDRDRDRSLSRDRYRGRDYDSKSTRHRERRRDRSWSRSRSPERTRTRSPARNGTTSSTTRAPPRRSRSPPRLPRSERRDSPRPRDQARDSGKAVNGSSESKRHGSKPKSVLVDGMDIDVDADTDDMDELMRKTMGFSSFRSTQNTKVPGNNVYGVRKEKKTEYRQYMNRQGGFNRPLSPSR